MDSTQTTLPDGEQGKNASQPKPLNIDKEPNPASGPTRKCRSQNALKWGFFSPKALLPGESWEEFEAFGLDLMQQLAPRNNTELHLLQQYIPLAWRVKRLPEIEAGIFTRYGISVQHNQCGPAFAMVANLQEDNILGQLARYEATLRKNMFKLLDQLRTLRKDGWGAGELVLDAQVVAQTSADPTQGAQAGASVATQTAPKQATAS